MNTSTKNVITEQQMADGLLRNDYTMEAAVEKAWELVAYVNVYGANENGSHERISFADALAICMRASLVDAVESHARDFWDYYREKVLGQIVD